jgi:hypothetical protein
MELHMATVSAPATPTASEPDLNAACERLDNYLLALRVADKARRDQIVKRILEMALARRAADSSQNLTTLAMEETRAAMERWFGSILGCRERIAVAGLVSMLAVDAPERWPVAFLSDDHSVEFRTELMESHVRGGPDLQVSSMVPRPLDVGPLLDPIHFPEAIGRLGRKAAIFAMAVVIAAFTFSLFLFAR